MGIQKRAAPRSGLNGDAVTAHAVSVYASIIDSRITRPRPGPGPTKTFPQDICICMLVKWLTEIYPLRPTRNGRSSSKPSACSILATALAEAGIHRGGKGAVQKIWMNYRDMVMSQPPLAMLGLRAA
jgi:hypothetical protein